MQESETNVTIARHGGGGGDADTIPPLSPRTKTKRSLGVVLGICVLIGIRVLSNEKDLSGRVASIATAPRVNISSSQLLPPSNGRAASIMTSVEASNSSQRLQLHDEIDASSSSSMTLSMKATSSSDSDSDSLSSSSSSSDSSSPQQLLSPEDINLEVLIGGSSYPIFDERDNNNNANKVINPAIATYMPLPKPVFVVGLPKAGTTSLYAFFEAAGYRSSHWRCPGNKLNKFCGLCIKQAVQQNLSNVLETCGNYEVWAQMDVVYKKKPRIKDCRFPQISDMEVLHREAPNATLILNRRSLDPWARSVQNWKGLDQRLLPCEGAPKSASIQDLQDWHRNHVMRIRKFVQKYPSHALIEVDIQDNNSTGKRLATLFQTSEEHWGQANKNPKYEGPSKQS